MFKIGEYSNLKVCRESSVGLYLTDGTEDPETGKPLEILLPENQCPDDALVGHSLKVFVYTDSEDRPIATRMKPTVVVGEFAFLQVVGISGAGAFFDWGLTKDLFCPFREQVGEIQEGRFYVVRAYRDELTGRVACSMRLSRYLESDAIDLEVGQKVRVMIIEKTPEIVIAIVNQRFRGAFFPDEWVADFQVGARGTAFVKRIRPGDGRLALSVRPQGYEAVLSEGERVLRAIEAAGGRLEVSDRSHPEEIQRMFGLSKGAFKKLIGSLYRQGKIVIRHDSIELPK